MLFQEAEGLEVVGSGLHVSSHSHLPDEREDEDEEQKENQYVSRDSGPDVTALCLTCLCSPAELLWSCMRTC